VSGVLDVIDSLGGADGSGVVTATWSAINGHLMGASNLAALSGFVGTHELQITWTGSPDSVYAYTASGDYNITGTGLFNVNPGGKLGFIVYSGASTTYTGTLTVTDVTAGNVAIATIEVDVYAP